MGCVVYTLADPRKPDEVRYIGFTADSEARLYAHLWEARHGGKTHKARWIRRLLEDGCEPLMQTIAEANSVAEAARAEIAAIALYRANGYRLTNGTNGGDGSTEWTERRRLERSEISRRDWLDTQRREQQREAMKAWHALPSSEWWRKKMHDVGKAVCAAEVWQARPEVRAKMRVAKLGKPHARKRTAEWNAKISAAQKGIKRRPWTPEERERHMAAIRRRTNAKTETT